MTNGGVRRERRADAPGKSPTHRRGTHYFVLLELPLLLLPLGEVAELPLGEVAEPVLPDVLGLGEVADVEPELDEPGEADGLLDGVPPTRSLSVRLHATVMPPSSARAQRPDSIFFIADSPPLWGVFRPGPLGCNRYARGGTMRARVHHVAQRRFAL